ncbi:non-specific lipid transfer protein GPI-anchored 1 [Magnolia sinica]|uniref:non-specific lipid transfer protein GPI-anchored 1 n=1 Tax=Magnolia sinica TaxID=86752 RepID=UPI00265B1FA9|nr:non-specific lipid transfer protein GPI-anchored 1 [Magnolia sinica]
MKSLLLFLSILLISSHFHITYTATPSIQERCTNEITKMMGCLEYSTAKSSEPSNGCCNSVKDIRNKDAVCLCFIIQKTYEGVPQLKELGLRVDRLIQLPTDCKLTNTSISDCPKLLDLPSNSPANAIFTNNATTTPATSHPDTAAPKSNGFVRGAGAIIVIAAVIFSTVHVGL